jgi:hypothetical protein
MVFARCSARWIKSPPRGCQHRHRSKL